MNQNNGARSTEAYRNSQICIKQVTLSARHNLIVIKNSLSNLRISVFIPPHKACYVIRHGRNDKSRKDTDTFMQIRRPITASNSTGKLLQLRTSQVIRCISLYTYMKFKTLWPSNHYTYRQV
jgi:hypothetical protein